MLALLGI